MFTIKEISNVCEGTIIYNNLKEINYFSTNSKDIRENTIFIPLIGKKYDAHYFIDDAIKNNLTACIVSKKHKNYKMIVNKLIENNISVVSVNDTFKSLIKLAKYNRYKNYDTKIIAITGSNGKTSTKDLIYDTLKNKYNVLKTDGNLNNIIGVSKTLLKLNNHDILVIELGMNHKKEISKLSKIVKPNISIITNIGSAHIGNMGSLDNIYHAKMEILDGMDNKILYVNGNDKYLDNCIYEEDINLFKYKYDYITYKKNFNYINIDNKVIKVKNNINPNNVCISYFIAKKFNIEYKEFIRILKRHKTPNMRLETIKIKNNIIINDCYNSNYESLINGINYVINNYNKKKIILVLGDILELGNFSKYYHELLAKYLNKLSTNIYKIYFVGNEIKYTYDKTFGIKKVLYNNVDEIKLEKRKNIAYYLKASRRIGLEKLIPKIQKLYK